MTWNSPTLLHVEMVNDEQMVLISALAFLYKDGLFSVVLLSEHVLRVTPDRESADISTSVNFNLLEPQRQRIDRVISQSSHPNPPTIEQSCPNASLEDNRHKRQSKLQEEHLAPLTPKLRIEQVQAIVITVTLPSSPVILTSSQPRKLGILLQSLQNRQVNFQLKCPTSRMRD